MAFFILYKFHGTLIEMNLNTHIFSQKRKLIVSYFYRNLPINPGTFFRLPESSISSIGIYACAKCNNLESIKNPKFEI